MTRYNTTHSPALEGCRDRVAALEAENARLREARDEAAELRAALDAARDAMVSALAYHHHSLSNPVKEELNAAINRAGRALAGGESDQ